MPKPAIKSAVQPPIPIIIMSIRFLYLRMFLIDILCRNLSLFQIKPIRSIIVLFPATGALGRISEAAFSLRSLRQTSQVAPRARTRYSEVQIPKSPQSRTYSAGRLTRYIILYTSQMVMGRNLEPIIKPAMQPTAEALPAYIRNCAAIAPPL